MKAGSIILIVLAILAFWGFTSYNGIIGLENDVEEQWSNVENAYQKRADKIKSLVATVKSYANHEKSTLEGVIEARAKATAINIDASNLTPETMAQFQSAQGGLSSALSKLMVSVERYPELKANNNYLSLQTEITSIENEIGFERKHFNETAKNYNNRVEKFPGNIFANIFNFGEKPYFKSAKGSDQAPDVEALFNN